MSITLPPADTSSTHSYTWYFLSSASTWLIASSYKYAAGDASAWAMVRCDSSPVYLGSSASRVGGFPVVDLCDCRGSGSCSVGISPNSCCDASCNAVISITRSAVVCATLAVYSPGTCSFVED